MLHDLRNFSIVQDYTAVLHDLSLSGRLFFFSSSLGLLCMCKDKEQDKEQKKNKTAVIGSINILTMEVPDNTACELQHINQFCAAGSNLSSEKSIAAKSQYL